MGKTQNLGGRGDLYLAEDKTFEFEVLDRDGVPVDTTGFAFSLIISLTDKSTALLTLPGTVAGTYSAVRATNAQRVTFPVTAAQMSTLTDRAYAYSAKRTDSGSKTVIAKGKLFVERANQ